MNLRLITPSSGLVISKYTTHQVELQIEIIGKTEMALGDDSVPEVHVGFGTIPGETKNVYLLHRGN